MFIFEAFLLDISVFFENGRVSGSRVVGARSNIAGSSRRNGKDESTGNGDLRVTSEVPLLCFMIISL